MERLERPLAWTAFMLSIICAVVETVLMQKLMAIFLLQNDNDKVYIACAIFGFVIVPFFVLFGCYSFRKIRQTVNG